MFIETEKMELPSLRRSQRVLARIALVVSGKINDEAAFEEETFTIAICAEGGLLKLRKSLKKGQRLSLFQAKTGQQEFCTVSQVEPIEDGFSSVRVHFLEPNPEFWHITFPPEGWTPRHPDSKFNRRPHEQNPVAVGA
jgi:hypothetical protein